MVRNEFCRPGRGRKIQSLLAAILGCCLLLTGCGQQSFSEETLDPPAEVTAGTTEPVPTETLPVLKQGLQTILVMGLDKYQAPPKAMGYLNDQQSDFLMLMVLDEAHGSCELLHLNRDTMTEIRRLGVGGGDAGRFQGQLALAHTYGSGGSDSCLNAVKAVSDFLGKIPIDHYVSMTMEAVGTLNDLAGGVTLELLDDFSHLDGSMTRGSTVTLMGDQALLYVRERGSLEDSSNLHRMERQRQYIAALWEKLQDCTRQDPDFLGKALLKLNASLQSDLSISQLDALGETFGDCTLGPIRSIAGEAVKGEEFMEFYPDREDLQAVIADLFYE